MMYKVIGVFIIKTDGEYSESKELLFMLAKHAGYLLLVVDCFTET